MATWGTGTVESSAPYDGGLTRAALPCQGLRSPPGRRLETTDQDYPGWRLDEAALALAGCHGDQYEQLDPRLTRQIDKALGRIQSQSEMGKPLRGELHGIWSERVSLFRILYKINRSTIEVLILVIEHRKLVYGGH
ncbi:MAG: type II toxin-antitoxin system RelE/ParE family toxin [Polyangiaceae bacterium]|nr:type II toxin-antitoxin system RelE/ParE family toxin [Polyangiaceae bacterium]